MTERPSVLSAIAELRELREQRQAVEDALVGADVDVFGESLADGVRRLAKQNAALVAAVTKWQAWLASMQGDTVDWLNGPSLKECAELTRAVMGDAS